MAKPKDAKGIADWGEKKAPTTINQAELVLPFPTPGLTHKQRKILAVEYLPKYASLTIAKKADIAGVSTRQWARFTSSEKFLEYAKPLCRKLYGKASFQITHAQIRKALEGGQDQLGDPGTQSKILQQLEILDKDVSTHNVSFSSLTDEQLREMIANAISISGPIESSCGTEDGDSESND